VPPTCWGYLPVAPGQRVPYAYTGLFGFQRTQPFPLGCNYIVADSTTVSEYLVVTVPGQFVTVGQRESFNRASRAMAFSSSRWILLPSELFILPRINYFLQRHNAE